MSYKKLLEIIRETREGLENKTLTPEEADVILNNVLTDFKKMEESEITIGITQIINNLVSNS